MTMSTALVERGDISGSCSIFATQWTSGRRFASLPTDASASRKPSQTTTFRRPEAAEWLCSTMRWLAGVGWLEP